MEGLGGKATLHWGNVHSLVSLVTFEGLSARRVERLVEQPGASTSPRSTVIEGRSPNHF